MRLFAGLPLPEDVRRKLHETYRVLENMRGVKTVEEENLHITLKFMGEVPEHRVKNVINTLLNIKYDPIYVEIAGVGAFPSRSFPRVVWAGVRRGSEEIRRLAETVERALTPLGIRRETRPFHPHVTLARVKQPCGAVHRFLEENKESSFGSFTVHYFVLFQSTLTPSGPIYTELARFPAEEL